MPLQPFRQLFAATPDKGDKNSKSDRNFDAVAFEFRF